MIMTSQTQPPNFFLEGSPFLQHPLLTAERTAREIDLAEAVFNLDSGSHLLDIGCGFGRHSIELARRGYRVTGVDPAAAMIVEAQKRALRAGVRVEFLQEEGECFTIAEPADGAICLFTSLGQISERGENSGLVHAVFKALKPGGRFLVEVPQRKTAVQQLKLQEQFGDEEQMTFIRREYDSNRRVVSEEFRIVNANDQARFLLVYRLFDQRELETLLQKAGFAPVAAYGNYQRSALREEDAIMLLVAEKKG